MNDLICKHNVTTIKTFVVAMITFALVFALSLVHPAANLWAMPWGQSTTPESFSTLAETVSPAVVNISTVKTIKGGGPVFHHFYQIPLGDQDPFKVFLRNFSVMNSSGSSSSEVWDPDSSLTKTANCI
jgi:S1-C subfamily serine protease